MSVRDLLIEGGTNFTPSEKKIVEVLLSDYPLSGLGTASSLARRATVSDPTVARLATKLGFDSYASMQAALRSDVEAGLRSPLQAMESYSSRQSEHPARACLISVSESARNAAEAVPTSFFEEAAELIMSAKGSVLVVGGRFSKLLASMLANYLRYSRGGIVDVGTVGSHSADLLIDVGRKDLVVAFDYRRYQEDVIEFVNAAVSAGAPLILFTDVWRSPLAAKAKVVFAAPTEVSSPHDTMVPGVLQLETLVALLADRNSGETRARIARLEELRSTNVHGKSRRSGDVS